MMDYMEIDSDPQHSLDENYQHCCDTILKLKPGGHCVPVISGELYRYPCLETQLRFAFYANAKAVALETLPNMILPLRSIELPMMESDQETFILLIRALHLVSDKKRLATFLNGTVREQGMLLPLLEMAKQYDCTEIAASCRMEIANLLRESVQAGELREALEIALLFTQKKTTDTLDGDFDRKSIALIKQHPVMRHVFYILRNLPSDILESHLDAIQGLPLPMLIHLILFPGLQHEQKRQMFAEALSLQMQHYSRVSPWSRQSASSIATWMVDGVLQSRTSSARLMRRSNSEEAQRAGKIKYPARDRAWSLNSTTDILLLPPITDGMLEQCEATRELVAIGMQRTNRVELAHGFVLKRTKQQQHFVSDTVLFPIHIFRSTPHIVRVETQLKMSLRYNELTKQLTILGALEQHHTQPIVAQMWTEYDMDPQCLQSLSTKEVLQMARHVVTFHGQKTIQLGTYHMDDTLWAERETLPVTLHLHLVF